MHKINTPVIQCRYL